MVSAVALAGCATRDQPSLQGWAVMNPSCLVLCLAAQEQVRDGTAAPIGMGGRDDDL